MHSDARELIELAKQLGFVFSHVDGHGHVRLVHENGKAASIASTPSDHRSRRNELARLERIAGRKLPRQKRRKSHKRIESTGFSVDVAARECNGWHAEHDDEIAELFEQRDDDIAAARQYARSRGQLRLIPPLLTRIAQLEERLRAMGQPVETFDPFSLAETE